MKTNKSDNSRFIDENNYVPPQKFILCRYISEIILFVLIFGTLAQICLLLVKINNLENKIITTIINNTHIVSDSEFNANITIKDRLLQENSTTQTNENYFKIINRTEWGAADSTGQLNQLNRPVGLVIIAHTETLECKDFDSCKYQMNILQLFYIQLRNFEDIGYNFLIGGDGAVYQGIGWDYIGYHTKGHNDNSIGIGFIGNYQNKVPTENQLSAAKLLLNYGLENNYLDRNYVVKGQRDFLPIVSPGENLYNRIKTWDHFFQK